MPRSHIAPVVVARPRHASGAATTSTHDVYRATCGQASATLSRPSTLAAERNRRRVSLRMVDLDHVEAVEIVIRPLRHLLGIAAVALEERPHHRHRDLVLPRDDDGLARPMRILERGGERRLVLETEAQVDWQAGADRQRLDGGERADVGVRYALVRLFIRRVGARKSRPACRSGRG